MTGAEDSLTRRFFASPYRSRRRASGGRRPLPSTRAFAPRSSASEASPLTPAEQRRRKRQKADLSSSFPSPAEGFASLLLSVAKRGRTLHFIDARRLPDSTVAFLVRDNSAHRSAGWTHRFAAFGLDWIWVYILGVCVYTPTHLWVISEKMKFHIYEFSGIKFFLQNYQNIFTLRKRPVLVQTRLGWIDSSV